MFSWYGTGTNLPEQGRVADPVKNSGAGKKGPFICLRLQLPLWYVFGLGEELHEAAIREVLEETGISTKFKSIVAFRQAAQFSARPPPPSA